jgi:hypothetical protein
LGEDNLHLEVTDLEEHDRDTTINPKINANNNGAILFDKKHVEMTSNDNARGLSNEVLGKRNKVGSFKKHGIGGTISHTKSVQNQGKLIKDSKLATRVTERFKGKIGNGPVLKKGSEKRSDLLDPSKEEKLIDVQIKKASLEGESQKKNDLDITTKEHKEMNGQSGSTLPSLSSHENNLGPKNIALPNVPRPPNIYVTPPNLNDNVAVLHDSSVMEGDKFIDATNKDTLVSDESDMEVVVETPGLKH